MLCVCIVFLGPLCQLFYVHALCCSTCQSVLGRIARPAGGGAWENRWVGACTWKGSGCRECAREKRERNEWFWCVLGALVMAIRNHHLTGHSFVSGEVITI